MHHHIGNFDIWALEVDSSNNILWDNCYGTDTSNEFPNAVCKAADGSIWIAGGCGKKQGEVDTSYGGGDAWIVHTDSAGNFLNAKVLGGSQADEGLMIYPLSNYFVMTGGYYTKNDGLFSPLNEYGNIDAFLATLAPWPAAVQEMIKKNSLIVFPNPANEQITIETKENGSLIVTDIIGRIIYKSRLADKLQIQVKDWQKGMYYVQMTSDNGNVLTNKFIKN